MCFLVSRSYAPTNPANHASSSGQNTRTRLLASPPTFACRRSFVVDRGDVSGGLADRASTRVSKLLPNLWNFAGVVSPPVGVGFAFIAGPRGDECGARG